MSAFADTSFVFAIYFARTSSLEATGYLQGSSAPIRISTLVRYEFLQGIWFEVWKGRNGDARRINDVQALSALADFELDVERGIWDLQSPILVPVLTRAEKLALNHTARHGARSTFCTSPRHWNSAIPSF